LRKQCSRRRHERLRASPPDKQGSERVFREQGVRLLNREFDSLLDTLAGLAAANIVLIETLHEQRVVDKTHFAHAFARALDTLAPEHRGGMIEHVLANMRDRCMNLPAGAPSDAREWLRQLLDQ
jgi:hypothetical protein